ncbi:MAG: hypothetical protein PHX39_04790, partial [Bacteroidales bacterium]|nr:hypothetical protein [Bacteroidales bacterium]
MKKYFFLTLFLFTIGFQANLHAQGYQDLWNATFTQNGDRSEAQILHNDFYNNVFVSINYHDTVFLPDTVFSHPTHPYV